MQTVTIPNYIRKVKLSDARQKKYYEFGKKHPKAKGLQNKLKYNWEKWPGFGERKFLVDLSTKERVVVNSRSAGTPKYTVINGQKIYNGEINKFSRNKVMNGIKESFMPYINRMKKIDVPIRIEMEIHDVILEPNSSSLWDLDNRAGPYIKAFQDCLTGNNGKCKAVIEDDNILYITRCPAPVFIPVENADDRKLVFIIKEETDKRIVESKSFKENRKLKNGKTTKK
jgi:hypothetical protein